MQKECTGLWIGAVTRKGAMPPCRVASGGFDLDDVSAKVGDKESAQTLRLVQLALTELNNGRPARVAQ